MDPVITWNLLLTAAGLPALGFFIKHLISKKEQMEEKTNIVRQAQAMERHQQVRMDIQKIENCLHEIKIKLENKVDIEDCKEKCDAKWELLNHHWHTQDGKVIVG